MATAKKVDWAEVARLNTARLAAIMAVREAVEEYAIRPEELFGGAVEQPKYKRVAVDTPAVEETARRVRRTFTDAEKKKLVKRANGMHEAGRPWPEIADAVALAESTLHRWRKEFADE